MGTICTARSLGAIGTADSVGALGTAKIVSLVVKLRGARRRKNLLIFGICQNGPDPPPPVFLDTYKALFFR